MPISGRKPYLERVMVDKLRSDQPRYLLATLKEVSQEEVLSMQRELDEYKSVMGSNSQLAVILQEMLDEAEKLGD